MSARSLPLLNLRRHEIATVLNVSVWKVDLLIRTEVLPSHKIGGTRVARYEDVKAYNDAQANASHAADTDTSNVIPMRASGRRKRATP